MKKSLVIFIVIQVCLFLVMLSNCIWNYIGLHPGIVFLIWLWIFVISSMLSFLIDIGYDDTGEPIMLECRKYPTCIEIIINGQDLFRYGQRDEMYELIFRNDPKSIFIRRPLNIFGQSLSEYSLVFRPNHKTASTTYNFVTPNGWTFDNIEQLNKL